MAVINKDKYLKDIASHVPKRGLYFEGDDRPAVMMRGRQVYISSVAFDPELEQLTYTVANKRGDVFTSEHGERRLSALDVRTLSSVSDTVRRYALLRGQRERNELNIASRLRMAAPSGAKGGPAL